jgi:hypothetical protein
VPTPAGLPRVVPPSGAVISGTKIPGGVRISPSAVSDPYLILYAGSREPERTFRVVLGRSFRAAARVSS